MLTGYNPAYFVLKVTKKARFAVKVQNSAQDFLGAFIF